MLAPLNHVTTLFGLDGCPLDFTTPRAWVALLARPNKEQDSADRLRDAHLFAYWPCYSEQVRHSCGRSSGSARRYVRMRAVIPGYLFVAVREGSNVDPWHVVSQTPGITGYMRDASGYPARLAEKDIETIRNIEAGQNLPFDPKTAHKFKVGEKVRFGDDLMGRWPPGRIVRLADNGRIIVDVPLLGRSVSITAFPHQIEAC